MHEQRFGSDQADGLTGAHMSLVSSYVEQAKGPPPRSALRFYIDGRWIEMASTEPEPVAESLVATPVAEPAVELTVPPAEPEVATIPLAATEELDDPDADPKLDLPIYRWFGTEVADDAAAAPGWPRSLLGRRDTAG